MAAKPSASGPGSAAGPSSSGTTPPGQNDQGKPPEGPTPPPAASPTPTPTSASGSPPAPPAAKKGDRKTDRGLHPELKAMNAVWTELTKLEDEAGVDAAERVWTWISDAKAKQWDEDRRAEAEEK